MSGSVSEGVSSPTGVAVDDSKEAFAEPSEPNPATSPEPESVVEPSEADEASVESIETVVSAESVEQESPVDAVEQEVSVEPETAAPAEPAETSTEPALPTQSSELTALDLETSIPLEGHSGQSLRNLVNLIYSKQALIGRALGFTGTIIEDAFITAIHDPIVDTSEKLMSIFSDDGGKLCPGITFDFDIRAITFKFFIGEPTAENVKAYTQFVEALNHTAKTLKVCFV